MNVSKLQPLSRAQAFAQIISANVPKATPDRDKILTDTAAFISQFPHLSTPEVKLLTCLRQENGNRDPQVVPFSRVASAEDLATNLEQKLSIGAVFVLKDGDTLVGMPEAAAQPNWSHRPAIELA